MPYNKDCYNIFSLYVESTETDQIPDIRSSLVDKLTSQGETRLVTLGEIIKRFEIVPTDEVPTMAVDNSGKMYYNPRWSNGLIESQGVRAVEGVLVHEAHGS